MNYWVRRIFHQQDTERQLASELRFHIEQRADELMQSGAAPEEALRQARLEFGGMEAVKQECRESRRVHFFEVLFQDLRYGLRMLRRNPGFTAVTILTLALGIGANTAIFSVVNGVLLNRLPYPDPDSLVILHESKVNFDQGAISYPNFLDWQKDNQVFTAMAAFRFTAMTLTQNGRSERIQGRMISSDFFPIVGVKPLRGRNFNHDEDRLGSAPVVMISEKLWRRRFGSSPDIINRAINLNDQAYTVVGVIPESFHLRVSSFNANDLYIPIGQWSYAGFRVRTHAYGMRAVARLKPGVSLAQAQADMDRVTGNLTRAYPEADTGIGARLIPLKQQMVGSVRPALLGLLATVGFVLLIACVNVANLLLARATVRLREFSIRTALGAARSRVIRQLLTESLLLSLAGGTLGLSLAFFGPRLVLGLLPEGLPRMEDVHPDWHVLSFAFLSSIMVGIIFGLAPAIRISRHGSAGELKESGRGLVPGTRRTQKIFVCAEMALALVLLIGAGLSLRSIANLWHVDPGFNHHDVVGFDFFPAPSLARQSPEAVRTHLQQIEMELRGMAGIQSVALGSRSFPLASDDEEQFWLDGQPRPASDNDMNWALWYEVTPDYFKTMGMSLKRGRLFSAAEDTGDSSPVVIVDESFARKFFPSQEALGKRIHLKEYDRVAEIVGIVNHVKQWGLDEDKSGMMQAQFYTPMFQCPDDNVMPMAGGVGIVVRSKTPPTLLLPSIQHFLTQMNSQQVIDNAQSLDEMVSDSIAPQRFTTLLVGTFAALALVLAAIGLYGVIAYAVGQRTQELGIRLALGATRGRVLGMVVGQGLRMAAMGALIGLAAALLITRLLVTFLYHVRPADPLTFVSVVVMMCLVSLLACYVPARRASRLDPNSALRCE